MEGESERHVATTALTWLERISRKFSSVNVDTAMVSLRSILRPMYTSFVLFRSTKGEINLQMKAMQDETYLLRVPNQDRK